MSTAKKGDTVKVHYTGKIDDGTVFDDSLNRQPLEFTVGQNRLIEGFEMAVIGMKAGEWKTVKIPSAKAYGPYRQELLFGASLDQFPEGLKPVIGQQLQITQDETNTVVVTVKKITKEKIILDANHPLAGKDLTFDIKLLEIVGS